jgi:ribosomal protein L17
MRAKDSTDGPFIRAFLSETYQRGRFDYSDFVDIVLSDFRQKMPGFKPVSYNVGEKVFFIKALSDVVIPDPVSASMKVGLLFSDSEVGAGCVVIRPFVRRKGVDLFILSEGFKRKHTGARKQLGVNLTTDVLKGGVQTDKLRISKNIREHIDKLVTTHTSDTATAKALILKYYDTELPIEDWTKESKDNLFKWLWKRCGASGLSMGHIKASIEKLEDYNMANLWGLFNALCEVAQQTLLEQQLEQEIAASKVVAHLYAILK